MELDGQESLSSDADRQGLEVLRPDLPHPTGSSTSEEPSPPLRAPTIELVFVGDVVLGEYVYDEHRSFAGAEAAADPFAEVRPLLEADLVVGNLESPVMTQVPGHSPLRYGHRFGGTALAVDGLAEAGFDVMSVANNHANDLGREGLEQTPEILRARGITPVGAARHAGSPFRVETVERQGWKVGLISATTWLNHSPAEGDPAVPLVRTSGLAENLLPVVGAARAEHDLLVVLLHWGRERREEPGFVQVRVAHELVDAGVDLVIGHHPHVLQGIERYRGGLIAYSIGNFLFPARDHDFRDSGVLRVEWSAEPDALVDAEVTPVRLGRAPSFAPEPAEGRHQRAIAEVLVDKGRGLRTRWLVQGEKVVMDTAPRISRG